MPEAELAHQEKTILDAFVNIHASRIGGHDFTDPGLARHPAHSHNTVHDVTLGKHSDQLSITQNRQRSNVVFHHEARRFDHSPVGFNRVHLAIFYQVVNAGHGWLLSGCPFRRTCTPPPGRRVAIMYHSKESWSVLRGFAVRSLPRTC